MKIVTKTFYELALTSHYDAWDWLSIDGLLGNLSWYLVGSGRVFERLKRIQNSLGIRVVDNN